MILRSLASLFVIALLALNWILPTAPISARGIDHEVRHDVESKLAIGRAFPDFELFSFDGRRVTRADLLGHRVLLTFERSVDW